MRPVTLYEDVGYGGISAGIGYGNYSNITSAGFPNDAVSSIKVAPFTKVVLYENTGFTGQSLTLYGPVDIPNLWEYKTRFEDIASSMQVIRMEPTPETKIACCTGGGYQCGEFAPGSGACNSFTSGFCSQAANIANPYCKTWCRSNTATCDPAVIAYCASNPTDPYCACLASPANTKGVINPKCADLKCLTSGYLTSSMAVANCPPIVTCEAKVVLENSGVSLSNSIPVQQNCGNTVAIAPDGTPILAPAGNVSVQTSALAAQPANSHLFLLFVLFILLSALVGLGFYIKRSRAAKVSQA